MGDNIYHATNAAIVIKDAWLSGTSESDVAKALRERMAGAPEYREILGWLRAIASEAAALLGETAPRVPSSVSAWCGFADTRRSRALMLVRNMARRERGRATDLRHTQGPFRDAACSRADDADATASALEALAALGEVSAIAVKPDRVCAARHAHALSRGIGDLDAFCPPEPDGCGADVGEGCK